MMLYIYDFGWDHSKYVITSIDLTKYLIREIGEHISLSGDGKFLTINCLQETDKLNPNSNYTISVIKLEKQGVLLTNIDYSAITSVTDIESKYLIESICNITSDGKNIISLESYIDNRGSFNIIISNHQLFEVPTNIQQLKKFKINIFVDIRSVSLVNLNISSDGNCMAVTYLSDVSTCKYITYLFNNVLEISSKGYSFSLKDMFIIYHDKEPLSISFYEQNKKLLISYESNSISDTTSNIVIMEKDSDSFKFNEIGNDTLNKNIKDLLKFI